MSAPHSNDLWNIVQEVSTTERPVEPQFIHHETLYFPDGDIILSVPKHNDTVALRLHRFMLSHHSSVFRDMFSLPPNSQVNETYDGVPVVRMSDDCEHLTKAIGALYNPE